MENQSKHDVDTTEHLVKIRKPYLDAKIALGRLKDIPDVKSLYATNAKITAMFLGAEPTERYDEREYVYPPNLKKELIPPEVIAFFDQIRNKSIPDDVLFKTKKKIMVDGCEFVYGWGGVHGGLPTYQEKTTDTRLTLPMTEVRGFSGGSRKSISGIRSSPEIRVCHHPSQDSAYSILGWQTIALSYTVCHRC
jgi:hypothetical protein